MRIQLIYLIFQILFFNACSQDKALESIRKDYEVNLAKVFSQVEIDTAINDHLLEAIIPITKEEFSKFYSGFEELEKRQLFEKVDEKIGNNAYNQVSNFFNLYIGMAEFINANSVSEEYLRNYYYDLDFIIEKNAETFCETFKSLNEQKKKNLKDFSEDYCE